MELLPLSQELETKNVLKKTAEAHRALGELTGCCKIVPNPVILLNTLTLQEAKDSSSIENIITTHDDLFRGHFETPKSPGTKEVLNYNKALHRGFELIQKGYLSLNMILEIQSLLVTNSAGFRKQTGTVLKDNNGRIIYTPPQDYDTIMNLMSNLEAYINNSQDTTDVLIKMAVIHHRFESIHPFYDGNGRTGRIINILYLVLNGLLEYPILYLSRYLIKNRPAYYDLLKEVQTNSQWEAWILYMLEGVKEISKDTTNMIKDVKNLMELYKHRIRKQLPRIYSKDLLENLFKHPYTRIESLQNDLKCTRQTASTYLEKLTENGFLLKINIGRNIYYCNPPLLLIFSSKNDT